MAQDAGERKVPFAIPGGQRRIVQRLEDVDGAVFVASDGEDLGARQQATSSDGSLVDAVSGGDDRPRDGLGVAKVAHGQQRVHLHHPDGEPLATDDRTAS